MRNFDIRDVSLGQIKYFIEVMECNSFTKAANRMHVSQSTISKNIASLENALGLILFIREKKALLATPAGKHLYNEWKQLTQRIETNIHDAFQIQMCNMRNLSVASLDSYNPDVFIMPAIEHFKHQNPDIGIRVENSPAQEIRHMLIENEIDVVFTILYDIEQLGAEHFDYIILGECPHVACMLKSNPLAEKEKLEIKDLASSDFVAISPLQTPSYIQMLRELCMPHGFSPNFTCFTASANSLALNLVTGNDVFICDKFFRDYQSRHLICKPLENTKSGFVIAWRKENPNKLTLEFVKETVEFLQHNSIYQEIKE